MPQAQIERIGDSVYLVKPGGSKHSQKAASSELLAFLNAQLKRWKGSKKSDGVEFIRVQADVLESITETIGNLADRVSALEAAANNGTKGDPRRASTATAQKGGGTSWDNLPAFTKLVGRR